MNKIDTENTKLMWKYANLFWKIIIIWGFVSLMYALFIFGTNLSKIFG